MKSIIQFLFFIIALASCNPDDTIINSLCDQEVKISSDLYVSAPNDPLTINSFEITGNCLLINYSSSGCDGSSWIVELIDSKNIMESYPPQRNIRLSLENEELCDAYITKEISFDISNLQVGGINKIYLNIANNDSSILYEY